MTEQRDPSDERFGSMCGGIRWFKGEPAIVRKPLQPVAAKWMCPYEDCGGEMKFNGMTCPTWNPGYHHTCTSCGFTAAIYGEKYPKVEYVDLPDEQSENPRTN